MIYQAILKIGGKEIPLLYYSYRCHIRHCDDPNLGRIIQLHIQVCEEIGNRENLPVEGDLITLMFECSGDEQFFYDWLNEGAMHYGEIHFIYNENEVVDIFRFWDCFCLKIEESMSAVNSPMVMTVYLSPGIIKRNNLEAREKEWRKSNVHLVKTDKVDNDIANIIYIKDAYWITDEGLKCRDITINEPVILYIQLKDYVIGKNVTFQFEYSLNNLIQKDTYTGVIDCNGIVKIENFIIRKK